MKISEITRDRESYMQKIQIKSRSFVKSTNIAIASLESFIRLQHHDDKPGEEPPEDRLLEHVISQIKT